ASQCAGALAASGVLRFLFPQNRLLGTTLPGWSALAVLCAGISPDGNSDVCDPAGFDWFAGQRNYRRDCGWVSDRSGSDVCRVDLPPAESLDLLSGSCCWCLCGGLRVSLCAGKGMLLIGTPGPFDASTI